jgi:hypothetical protein
MANIRNRFFVVNASVSFDMWEKIAKVYPHSKRKIHYEEEKLLKYGMKHQNFFHNHKDF